MTPPLSDPFTDAASNPARRRPKRRRPSSLSIRVSDEERAILKRKAGKRSLGAYVRDAALGDDHEPRRKRAAKPPLDYAMLGQVLGKLGQSEQVVLKLAFRVRQRDRLHLLDIDSTPHGMRVTAEDSVIAVLLVIDERPRLFGKAELGFDLGNGLLEILVGDAGILGRVQAKREQVLTASRAPRDGVGLAERAVEINLPSAARLSGSGYSSARPTAEPHAISPRTQRSSSGWRRTRTRRPNAMRGAKPSRNGDAPKSGPAAAGDYATAQRWSDSSYPHR